MRKLLVESVEVVRELADLDRSEGLWSGVWLEKGLCLVVGEVADVRGVNSDGARVVGGSVGRRIDLEAAFPLAQNRLQFLNEEEVGKDDV